MNIDKNFTIEDAEIITVGTEILIGQVLNTNSQFLASSLHDLGINSKHQQVVGDNPERLYEAIRVAMGRSDLVILTGGLGPTKDDISLEIAAKATNNTLASNHEIEQEIEDYFEGRERDFTENNLKQAIMPVDGISLHNDRGTAPGVLMQNRFEDERDSLIALLPGPPRENTHMFKRYLKPELEKYSNFEITSIYIQTMGIGESRLASILDHYLANYSNPSIATYPEATGVVLRLTYRHEKGGSTDALYELLDEIRPYIEEYEFAVGDTPINELLFDSLVSVDKNISFAESVTAGIAASGIADLPGASQVLQGGVITYHNEIKENVLNISSELLERYGSISSECAIEMAKSARKMFNSDYAVSITGNAGPTAIEDKPLGLIYIAIASEDGVVVKEYNLSGDRNIIRTRASQYAYVEAYRFITGK